ncbi:MAG: C2 family cysteine protease [Actinomycetota bacterium]|nr:C2 family cysteine protease [Actinomycetota bacterium]
MAGKAKAAEVEATANTGVINPYALAEQIAGRRIDWKSVPSVPELLEDLLQTPYAELFDPAFGGPLYTGLQLDADLRLQRVHSPLLDVAPDTRTNDLDQATGGFGDIRILADLAERFRVKDVGRIGVSNAAALVDRLVLTIPLPEKERDSARFERLSRVLTPDLVNTIAFDPERFRKLEDGWTPPNGSWRDSGRFFNEAAEFFDPIQGAVANCYYIAALSAVAWATPYRINHLARATGLSQERFTNMIRFFKADSGGALDQEIEVTDTVPVNAGGATIYCRSSEAGETWPAIYEKAFAKLVTGTTGDHPDITATGWGDCVLATARLNGGTRSGFATASRSGDQIWDIVRANSRSRRTFNPMTAWTYSTGQASEKKVVYDDSNIVASHCYTVLGWDWRDGKKYLILRNPWGTTEATVGQLSGTWLAHDVSFWRPIALANPDGVFGIEASVFKTYFAGLGTAH